MTSYPSPALGVRIEKGGVVDGGVDGDVCAERCDLAS